MFVRPSTPFLRREAGLTADSPIPPWVWPLAMGLNLSWFLWDVGLTSALWGRLRGMTLAQARAEPGLIPAWWGVGMLGHLLAAWWLPALMVALAWARRDLPPEAPARDAVRGRVWLWFWPLLWIDVTWWLWRGVKAMLLATAPVESGVRALAGDLPLDPAGALRLLTHFTLGPLNALGLSIFMLLLASWLAAAWRRPLAGFAIAAGTALGWYVLWHVVLAPRWRTLLAPSPVSSDAAFAGELALAMEAVMLWGLIALLLRSVWRMAAQTGGHAPGGR